jgi:ribonuclease R
MHKKKDNKKNNLTQFYNYLVLKAGSEIPISSINTMFDVKDKSSKIVKKKDGSYKIPNAKKMEDFAELLGFLEYEGFLTVHKKYIQVEKNIKLTGKISLSKRGDGFVKLKSGQEVFVYSENTAGAIQGDLVEVIPKEFGKKGKLECDVREIVKRGRDLYRMKISEIEGNYFYGKLLDMGGEIKEGLLSKKSLLIDVIKQIKLEDVVIVKLKENSNKEDNLFEVNFVRFEDGTTRDKDLNRILMKYNYQQVYPTHVDLVFPEDVNKESVDDWEKRVDLRNLWSVTIDGDTSKDFDDAVSIVEEGDIVRFYVHIADVSYYVRQNSALDEEAYRRATSIYLIDSVIPMLPPILSENLCSLVANKDRLAFTIEMEADYKGRIYSAKFYKSIINVDNRLTYDIVQSHLDNNSDENLVKLMKLANGLKEHRIHKGRVDLNLKEVYISTEENGDVKEFKWRERKDSHIMIEELMLSANVKVAEFLRKKNIPALYRIHESMDEEKLESLNSFLTLYGFKHQIESTDYDEIQLVLQKIRGTDVEKIFNYFLLRSFMQAYYGGENMGHWGLGFKDYCHFTSPIRRYPDLVVHRVLDAVLHNTELPYQDVDIKIMGLHTSEEERRAADSERDIQKIKSCRYIQKLGITEFTGIIIGIKPQFVFVELEGYFGEGTISHVQFTNEYDLDIRNDFSFYSKKYTKTYFLGEKIEVVLDKIDYEEMRIFLKLK